MVRFWQCITFMGLLVSLSANASIWTYSISGDLNYHHGPISFDPVLDGGFLEFNFTIDDSVRIIQSDGNTLVFTILGSSLWLYNSEGGLSSSSTYTLETNPSAQPLPSLIVNKLEQNETTKLSLYPEFSSDIAYHELGFYELNLPRADIAPSDLADFFYFVGSQNTGGIYRVDNMVLSISNVPIPAAAWLFGSALLGMGALKRNKV